MAGKIRNIMYRYPWYIKVELNEERTGLLDSRTGFDSCPVLHPRLSWRKFITQSRRSTQLKRKDIQQIKTVTKVHSQ
jgi:hypothetical protein